MRVRVRVCVCVCVCVCVRVWTLLHNSPVQIIVYWDNVLNMILCLVV